MFHSYITYQLCYFVFIIVSYELADQWLVNVVLGPPDDVYMLTDEVAGLLETPETEGDGLNQLALLVSHTYILRMIAWERMEIEESEK